MSSAVIVIAAQVFQLLVAGYWVFPAECPDAQSWQYIPAHDIYACRQVNHV